MKRVTLPVDFKMAEPNFASDPWKLSPRAVAFGVAAVVVVTVIYGVTLTCFYPTSTERGTFGDMFGALNAMFSGLAFLGVVAAIYLQQVELRAQQHEMRQAREAQQASANALHEQLRASESATRIQGLNLLIETTRSRLANVQDPASVPEFEQRKRLVTLLASYEVQLAELIDNHLSDRKAL